MIPLPKCYIIKCNDGSFYVGVTYNSERRLEKHNNGTGSEFLKRKGKKPFQMFVIKSFDTWNSALNYEKNLKKSSRKRKQFLIDCSIRGATG